MAANYGGKNPSNQVSPPNSTAAVARVLIIAPPANAVPRRDNQHKKRPASLRKRAFYSFW